MKSALAQTVFLNEGGTKAVIYDSVSLIFLISSSSGVI